VDGCAGGEEGGIVVDVFYFLQKVIVPQGIGPGMQIDIQVPRSTGIPPSGHSPAPPPRSQPQVVPPPPPGASQQQLHQQQQSLSSAMSAMTLSPQCEASKRAEAQLRTMQGTPDPALIFAAMDRDGSGAIDADELQFGLSQGGRMEFSRKTCVLLVHLYDSDKNNTVGRNEFLGLWGYLDQWRNCFQGFDRDRSGFISKVEMIAAIKQIGYSFSDAFYDQLLKIYDFKKKGEIGFDAFVALFCELHLLTEEFKKKDVNREGVATFKYEEFLVAAYSVHI